MKGIKRTLKEKIALLRLKQGDTEAFGYIYDVHIQQIYRFIYFRTSDKAVAYDLAQDVFLITWEYIVSNKPIENLRSFMYRVAHNKIVDFYRSRKHQATLLDDLDEGAVGIESMDTTGLDMHFVHEQIKKLKSEYQDVLLLRHVEGFSIREIAAIIGKDPNSIRVVIHRAITALKELYAGREEKNHQE